MSVYFVVLLSVLSSIGHRGSKVAVSLSALELGASPLTIGVLAALYAVFPLLLAVYAGRISDRFGVRYPILFGSIGMAAGLFIPAVNTSLPALFVCPALIGLAHVFFHVSIHNAVGSFGDKSDRTRNFSIFSLGASIAAFIGPSLTGFSIDMLGFRASFVMLGLISLLVVLLVNIFPRLIPQKAGHHDEKQIKNAFTLLKDAPLRRTLIMSGVTLTGIELFSFYLPIYGQSVGLSASWIGLVLGAYAAASFIVRLVMHKLAHRYTETGVLTGSLFVAAITYCLIPFFTGAPALMLIAFMLGLGLGSAQPLTIMLTYNHAPQGRSGEALGLRLSVNKVTQIAVPLLFGGIGGAFGLAPVFAANALFLFGGGLVSLRDHRMFHATRPDVDPAELLATRGKEGD